MLWDLSPLNWWIGGSVAAVLLGLAVLRPWRFWWARRHCPQCGKLLARWNWWGWKLDWTCPRCGCQIDH